VPGVLLAQGYAVAEQAELYGVSTDRRARMLDFGALDEAQNHESLHLRIGRIHSLDDAFLAAFQGCERVTVESHELTICLIFRHFPDNCRNDNDSHYDKQ